MLFQKHRKRGKSKLDRLGIPEEELARQQQQLFDEARQQQMEVCISFFILGIPRLSAVLGSTMDGGMLLVVHMANQSKERPL